MVVVEEFSKCNIDLIAFHRHVLLLHSLQLFDSCLKRLNLIVGLLELTEKFMSRCAGPVTLILHLQQVVACILQFFL
jgi:hypothetical protein